MKQDKIEEFISKLQGQPNATMIQATYFTKLEFNESEKNLSDKLRWYLLTVDDLLFSPDILSKAEKEEFINLHLAYVSKYRKQDSTSN